MIVHLVSETEFGVKSIGIHTAHLDLINLLKSKKEIDIKINGEGHGDVFHSHTYGLYYFLKGFRYKGRRIHTVHTIPDTLKGSVPFYKLIRPFAELYFKLVYNYADVCLAISPKVEETLIKMKIKSKIIRINNPVDLEFWAFTETKKKLGRDLLDIEVDEFVVLGVGQIQQRKGVEDFIEMAQALPMFKFIWVGGRPFKNLTEGINRIDNKIKNAPANIHFKGIIDLGLMPSVYAAANVLIFPSYQENSPLAPIEAAAAGLPVIFRDIDEYKSLYKSPYLKASSISEFIDHIKRINVVPSFHILAIKHSKELLRQFDKNVIHSKLLELYHELNDKKK
jgi:1,2-diacylglycerol-3-alpha-glucose alpha-1,2-galactosyltransferase